MPWPVPGHSWAQVRSPDQLRGHIALGGSFTGNGPESHEFLVILYNCGSLLLYADHTDGQERGAMLEHPCLVLFAAPFPYGGGYYAAAWLPCLVLPSRLSSLSIVACRDPVLTFHVHTAVTERADTDSPRGYSSHLNQRTCFKCRKMTMALQWPRNLSYLFLKTHGTSLY